MDVWRIAKVVLGRSPLAASDGTHDIDSSSHGPQSVSQHRAGD
jgi:hypothetical protein